MGEPRHRHGHRHRYGGRQAGRPPSGGADDGEVERLDTLVTMVRSATDNWYGGCAAGWLSKLLDAACGGPRAEQVEEESGRRPCMVVEVGAATWCACWIRSATRDGTAAPRRTLRREVACADGGGRLAIIIPFL